MENKPTHNKLSVVDRKKFLQQCSLLAAGISILPGVAFAAKSSSSKDFTIQDVMDIIIKQTPGAPFPATVDTLKTGNPATKVSGIITTMFATVDTIKKAARRKANFIIAHEPLLYNHRDDREWVANNNVMQQKVELLDKLGIAVWRCHDYAHSLQPDLVRYGFAKKTGWLNYLKQGEYTVNIPSIRLESLVKHLKQSLSIQHVRVMGDLSQECKRVLLVPGAAGGQRQVAGILKDKPDVIVVGETVEWETVEFIRDGLQLGEKTSFIILGHAVSEEPGMEWMAEWLRPQLPGISISHIATKDPFTWM